MKRCCVPSAQSIRWSLSTLNRYKVAIGLSVIAVVAVLAASGLAGRSRSAAAELAPASAAAAVPAARPVAVLKVTLGTITEDLRILGTVTPLNQVAVQSQIDGPISAVLFSEGQRVSAGEPLLRIDPRPYEAEVERAAAGVEKDQADLQAATLLNDRLTALNRKEVGTLAEKDLDAQRALVASLTGALHQAQAQWHSSRVRLEYATIRSPIAGRVGKRLVDVGNVLRAADGTRLTLITQIHPIAVDFSVPQEHLAQIRALQMKQGVRIEVRASRSDSLLDVGKLTLLGDSIDPKTGSITLRAQCANRDEQLWPGQLVDVRVTLAELREALVIPQQAIRATASGSAVFVVDRDSHLELRPVSIGIRSDGHVSITQGLSPGETVVVEGVDGLSAHMQVSPVADSRSGQ
jgi:membrane fusion protein, multidrug efflux system